MVVPVCIPLVSLLVGMVWGWRFPAVRDGVLCGLPGAALLACAAFALCRRPVLRLLPRALCFVLVGAARTSLRLNPRFPEHHLVRLSGEEPVLLEGTLCEAPRAFPGGGRFTLEAVCVRQAGGCRPATGRIDLFLNGRAPAYAAGDTLLVQTRVRRIRDPGNPGEFRASARSFLRRVYVRGNVQDPDRLMRLSAAGGPGLRGAVHRVRERILGFLQEGGISEGEALLAVWLLGDRSSLPEEASEAFRRSGLAHLLALSGLHVGMVALFFYAGWTLLLGRSVFLLRRGAVPAAAALASLPGVLFYVLAAGSPVTAVRAGLMVSLFAGARVLGRTPSPWNALGMAALLILLGSPAALFDPAFSLSFVTVCVLLAGLSHRGPSAGAPLPPPGARGGRASVRVQRLVQAGRRLLRASLVAGLAAAPLTALYFNSVTPLAVFANLAAVPLVCWVVLPVGMITGGLSLFCLPLARAVLRFEEAGAGLVLQIARAFSRIPGACLPIGTPTGMEIGAWYALLLLALMPRRPAWTRLLAVPCLGILLLSPAGSVLSARSSRELGLDFLSVGNGDSSLLVLPGGRRLLLDGGPARPGAFDAGRKTVIPFLGARRFCRLDALVVSHGQADHYGGLLSVAERFRPAELWIPPEHGGEEAGYPGFLRECGRLGMAPKRLCRGTVLTAAEGVTLEVLHPPCGPAGAGRAAGQGVNDRSLVLRVTLGRVRILFTGDIERVAETDLLSLGDALRATVLKVPHHGSSGSSSAAFLDAVQPRVAVVSSGYGNRFGFPSRTVVERYRERGVSLYRTSHDGAVSLRTDGRVVSVRSHRGRAETFTVAP